MHLQWIDINFSMRTLQVRSKPQYEHRVKTAEERELPLTQELVAQLQAFRQHLPAGRKLVFGKLADRKIPQMGISSAVSRCLRRRPVSQPNRSNGASHRVSAWIRLSRAVSAGPAYGY
jgi:integrase